MRLLFVVVSSAVSAIAQSVLYVDATGVGGAFPTLQAAVAAATDGDVIRVRPTGVYDFTTTITKGLAIVADSTVVSFEGPLQISGVPASQRCIVRGLRPANSIGQQFLPAKIRVVGCAGPVSIEEVVLDHITFPACAGGFGCPALEIVGCAQVTVDRCTAYGAPALRTSSSHVAVSGSTLQGQPAVSFWGQSSSVGLDVVGGALWLSGTVVRGGNGDPVGGLPGRTAASIDGIVRVAGGALTGGYSTTYEPAAVVAANQVLTLDSSVALSGAVVGNQAIVDAGRVEFVPAAPGQPFTAGLVGPAGSIGALAWGLPAPPLPTFFGEMWFDPGAYVVIAIGVLPLAAVSVPLPAFTVPGELFTLQGLVIDQGQWRFSNPVRWSAR